MAKLVFKQSQLQGSILPSLETGINNISKASEYLNSVNPPASYDYTAQLNQVKQDLVNINKSLQVEKERISSSIPKIVRIEEELKKDAATLQIAEIIKRENKIEMHPLE